MTYKELLKIFYVFAAQHPLINQWSWGNLSDYQRDNYIQKYVAIHFVPQLSQVNNTYTDFNWTILIFDKLNEWVGDETKSNQIDCLSICQQILVDFYAFFTNQLTKYGYFLQDGVQFTPFIDRLKEDVAGVEATISIRVEGTTCIPPFIEQLYLILFESGDIMTTENNEGVAYEQQ
jgi:hypothetical protein